MEERQGVFPLKLPMRGLCSMCSSIKAPLALRVVSLWWGPLKTKLRHWLFEVINVHFRYVQRWMKWTLFVQRVAVYNYAFLTVTTQWHWTRVVPTLLTGQLWPPAHPPAHLDKRSTHSPHWTTVTTHSILPCPLGHCPHPSLGHYRQSGHLH